MSDTPDKGGRPPTHGGYARPVKNAETAALRQQFLELILDGRPDPSGPESIVAGLCADALLRWHTVNEYIDEHGPLTKTGAPRHVLKVYIGLLNAARRGLETLGLRPDKTKDLPTLDEYLKARKQNGNGAQGAPTPAAVQSAPPATVPQPSPNDSNGDAA